MVISFVILVSLQLVKASTIVQILEGQLKLCLQLTSIYRYGHTVHCLAFSLWWITILKGGDHFNLLTFSSHLQISELWTSDHGSCWQKVCVSKTYWTNLSPYFSIAADFGTVQHDRVGFFRNWLSRKSSKWGRCTKWRCMYWSRWIAKLMIFLAVFWVWVAFTILSK